MLGRLTDVKKMDKAEQDRIKYTRWWYSIGSYLRYLSESFTLLRIQPRHVRSARLAAEAHVMLADFNAKMRVCHFTPADAEIASNFLTHLDELCHVLKLSQHNDVTRELFNIWMSKAQSFKSPPA